MKYLKFTLLFIIALGITTTQLNGQSAVTELPRGSQKQTIIQRIGITDITVEYHRPAVKDREVWGKMVPYNSGQPIPWRAGANENTIINFTHDVTIEGKELAAGKYGLHMIPSEGEWTIIFSSNYTSWGSFSYNPAEDVLRVKVMPGEIEEFNEFLNYQFYDLTETSATCALNWANKRIGFNIAVDVHGIVVANLTKELRSKPGWTWIGWNEAANYCLANKVNLKQGIQWAGRSVWMNPNFINIQTQANILAELNGSSGNKEQLALKNIESIMKNQNVGWIEWDKAAKFCLANDHLEEGLSWAEQSIELQPNLTNRLTRVDILLKQNSKKEAIQFRESALASASNAEVNTYAYKIMFRGRTKEAVALFEANAEKYPSDPNVWDSLGEGYFRNGQNQEAIDSFQRALSLNPPPNVRQNSQKYLSQLGVKIE